MTRIVRLLFSGLIFLSLLDCAPRCEAQTHRAGDKVEVFFLNKWWPAVVVKTNQRGEVLAEYQFAGGPKQRVFQQNEIRFLYESGALALARNWSDPTGKFRVKAALLAIDDKEVTLRKSDMTEIKVEINKLSDADRQFLKKLQTAAAPAAQNPGAELKGVAKAKAILGEQSGGAETGPTPPPVETFAVGEGNGETQSLASGNGRVALEPDPVPAFQKIKQGGVGFAMEHPIDRIGAVLSVGASDVWLLAAVENGVPGHQLPTRLLWVSLARQKVERRQLLPAGEKLLDYHAASHRLLTFNWLEASGGKVNKGTLSLWETMPTAKEVKPIARWHADSERDIFLFTPWARLIDGNLVVHRAQKQHYFVWDVAAKKSRYEIDQESYLAPEPVLSGNRRYLFVPEDHGVCVLESATGKWLTTLPSSDGVAGVGLSEDGKRAAVLGRSKLSVWDLATADAQPQVCQAEAIGTSLPTDLFWAGPDRIVASAGAAQRLFSLKSKVTLWRYEFDDEAVSDNLGARVREVSDRHLVYAAKFGSGRERGLAVGAVLLPGPNVDDAEARLDVDSLYALKPGAKINLVVNLAENSARVQKALEEKIRANGWIISSDAEATLTAEITSGQSQTVRYRMMRVGGPGYVEEATFTPQVPSLKVQLGEAVAWATGQTSRGAPPFVNLREGQSVQEEVDKWQKPRPEFFEGAKIPPRILHPKYREGLGTTLVNTRGLVPKGSEPAAAPAGGDAK